jgi:diadenosine tetraphosphate (Ap4A) HIT family hydrolase
LDQFISGCLSCDIVAGKQVEPGGVIYENTYWHVGSAVGPPVWRGFLVIKLKRHCEHLAELTPAEAAALGPVMRATCLALSEVLSPAKVYLCSFGDRVRHIHFWALPRPVGMRPGMHSVMFNLDTRLTLTRLLGIKKWVISDEEMGDTAGKLREIFARQMENKFGI